jgi:hypothetical protein
MDQDSQLFYGSDVVFWEWMMNGLKGVRCDGGIQNTPVVMAKSNR